MEGIIRPSAREGTFAKTCMLGASKQERTLTLYGATARVGPGQHASG